MKKPCNNFFCIDDYFLRVKSQYLRISKATASVEAIKSINSIKIVTRRVKPPTVGFKAKNADLNHPRAFLPSTALRMVLNISLKLLQMLKARP